MCVIIKKKHKDVLMSFTFIILITSLNVVTKNTTFSFSIYKEKQKSVLTLQHEKLNEMATGLELKTNSYRHL